VFGLADLDDLPPMETLSLRRSTSPATPVATAGAAATSQTEQVEMPVAAAGA